MERWIWEASIVDEGTGEGWVEYFEWQSGIRKGLGHILSCTELIADNQNNRVATQVLDPVTVEEGRGSSREMK